MAQKSLFKNDSQIISKLCNKNRGLLSNWYRQIENNKDIKNYLLKRFIDKNYSDNKNDLKEICLRIINKTYALPKCPICNKSINYLNGLETCGSKECMAKLRQQRNEEANLKKYGVKNQFQRKEIVEKLNTAEFLEYKKQKLEAKYGDGIRNISQIPEVQAKRVHTFMERYGENITNASQLEETKIKVKKTNQERYGKDYYLQTQDCREKRKSEESLAKEYETKKKNGTLGISKIELQIFDKIKEKFPNAINQYRSAEYPFNCDFYIPELDLYIEYQGFWTHGNHPYDPNNDEDNNWLEEMKTRISRSGMYIDAIYVWTEYDPLKRQIAKQNNLNWIEFFNYKQFEDWFRNVNNKVTK